MDSVTINIQLTSSINSTGFFISSRVIGQRKSRGGDDADELLIFSFVRCLAVVLVFVLLVVLCVVPRKGKEMTHVKELDRE
jgi:hypothetical protein